MKPTLITNSDNIREQIEALLDAVRKYAPAVYEAYAVAAFGPIPAWVRDDDDSPWYESEEAEYLLTNLRENLEDWAPEGFYFGLHPDRPLDWGFWPVEEA